MNNIPLIKDLTLQNTSYVDRHEAMLVPHLHDNRYNLTASLTSSLPIMLSYHLLLHIFKISWLDVHEILLYTHHTVC